MRHSKWVSVVLVSSVLSGCIVAGSTKYWAWEQNYAVGKTTLPHDRWRKMGVAHETRYFKEEPEGANIRMYYRSNSFERRVERKSACMISQLIDPYGKLLSWRYEEGHTQCYWI
jgi:hypothetical protein